MKTVILTACILIIGYTGLAQIKKPTPIKTDQLKNLQISEAQLKRMTPKQISNLPLTTIDRDKLLILKPNESWNLDAPKLSDKDLFVKSLFGFYRSDGTFEIHPIFVHDNRNGFSNLEYMKFQFRPETNQRYRLLIKLEPGDYPNHHVMFNTGGANRAFQVNDQYDEILLDFRADSNGFAISNLVKRNEPNMLKIHHPLKIKSIKLDKVE